MIGKIYNTPFHGENLSNYKFLVTGGAGFIGSNLVSYLLRYNAGHVRVLDNLSNGYFENIGEFVGLNNFEFIEGDIRDFDTCKSAVNGIDFVSHQAALGSVPRSIKDPILTNSVNISGFLNILTAAKEQNSIRRFIYAASSSTYGDHSSLPKIENIIGNPLSPYAVTKLVNELYGDVFSKVYNYHTIGLRYFNVFGPGQNPDNPYAAAIPLFLKAAKNNESPIIFGDGETTRDFTFVENAIQANIKALLSKEPLDKHEVINIACGQQTSLLQLWKLICEQENVDVEPIFKPKRNGDILHSLANIDKAKRLINYEPTINVKEGLKITINEQFS
jgi:UDP-N-acetylglucosamine 4-epimerase